MCLNDVFFSPLSFCFSYTESLVACFICLACLINWGHVKTDLAKNGIE